jgi:hypothetical protein
MTSLCMSLQILVHSPKVCTLVLASYIIYSLVPCQVFPFMFVTVYLSHMLSKLVGSLTCYVLVHLSIITPH